MVAPRWPSGPIPWLAIGGMVTGITSAFFPATRTWPIIQQAFSIGTFVFRSAFGLQVVMGLAIAAHIIEGFITVHICVKNKVSTRDTLGWFGMALWIGYGAIYQLNSALKQAA